MAKIGRDDPTAADESGAAWTNETNVFASDDSRAVYTGTGQEFLRVTDFAELQGFPSNGIPRGFEVTIEGFGVSMASSAERTISVDLTVDGSTGIGTPKTLVLGDGTDAVGKLGGPTDEWGAVYGTDYDNGDLQSATFGIRIQKNTATSNQIDIDHVMMTVFYDGGIEAAFDIDFTNKETTYVDAWFDYDTGSGGTAPADGDVLRNTTASPNLVGEITQVSTSSVLLFGSLGLSDVHDHDAPALLTDTWSDGDVIEVLSYVDFDTEAAGGISELDIGKTFSATGGTGTRTGTIRHVISDGVNGRMWWSDEGGTAFTGDESIQVPSGGTTVADAAAAEVSNAWTGALDGASHLVSTGYLDYDTETTSFEDSTGSGRIRSSDFQHNICVVDDTTNATAMIVDDTEDPNATDTGRLYISDDDGGTFTAANIVEALEELEMDAVTAGFFAVGDTIGDSGSPTHTWVIRRMIHRGTTAHLYIERATGTARFADNDAVFIGATQRGTANGAQLQRLGSATIATGGVTSVVVQWLHNHIYTEYQRQFRQLLAMDDRVSLEASVRDQQYTTKNNWDTSFWTTRRYKKGALNQGDAVGGADVDSVSTDYFHLGSVNGTPNFYVDQNATVLDQFWDPGSPMDVLLRNKNKNANVNGGLVTWYVRPFGDLYDFSDVSAVGLRNPVPLNTAPDINNTTPYATVRDDASDVYMTIEVAWASHTLNFNTGAGGTFETGDVIFNSTDGEAGMVARVPDSFTSGTDLHLAVNGQDITGWGSGSSLEVLDYFDYDGQNTNDVQFTVGQAIENAADTWNATVRWVQQFGGERGRVWISGASGTLGDNEDIEPDGGGTVIAQAKGTVVSRSGWTGLTNTATPETADNTVLKDVSGGTGGADHPYNVVINLNGATVAQFYEWTKFITEERAGSSTDPGTLLYPNDAAVEGRLYQKADSTYGSADLVKAAPFGSFAGGQFFGARGVFIENMAAADAQSYSLIDANGTARNPPNFQSITVNNTAVGDSVVVYPRPEYTASLTYNDNDGTGNSEITQGSGDFVDEGFVVGEFVTISDTTSNNITAEILALSALTMQLKGVVLTDEGPVSSTLTGSNVNERQFTGAAGNNSGDPDFVVNEALPGWLPATGFITIRSTSGEEVSSGGYEYALAYTSYTGSTFTLAGTLPQTFSTDARISVPFIYATATASSESVTLVYSADVPVIAAIQGPGILRFEVNDVFDSDGLSVQVIRTSDTIAE